MVHHQGIDLMVLRRVAVLVVLVVLHQEECLEAKEEGEVVVVTEAAEARLGGEDEGVLLGDTGLRVVVGADHQEIGTLWVPTAAAAIETEEAWVPTAIHVVAVEEVMAMITAFIVAIVDRPLHSSSMMDRMALLITVDLL